MAMGRRTRDEAERAIASCRPFQNSTGSMRGTRGSTRHLGWLEQHTEKARIKELLGRATYVVWSYDTPIGCVTEDEEGNIAKVYFDEFHTQTTSNHQGILRVAFSDFETIGERRPARRRAAARPVNQDAVDRANRVVTEMAEAARREPTAAHVYAAVARRREAEQATREQMLDPRYQDPDWTPWKTNGSNLPPGAEDRDELRVRTSGGTWTP